MEIAGRKCMSVRMGVASLVSGIAIFLISHSVAAQPSIVNFSASSPGLIIGNNFLSQIVDGVEVKVRGYTVEFNGNNSQIYGPYPTGDKIFGVMASGFDNRPGFGSISQPLPGINTTGMDFGGNTYAPGFDNGLNGHYLGDNVNIPGDPLPKIEFALFTFSSPVQVSQVIVSDVVNSIATFGQQAERLHQILTEG